MDYRERIDNNETQVSLWLPSDLWRQVRAQASLTGVTVGAWVEGSLRTSLGKQAEATARGVDVAAGVQQMVGGRRAGRTRLRGRPLDDDGRIALTVERTPDPFPGLADTSGSPKSSPRSPAERSPGAVCRRCKIPWRNHQEGQFGNRAGLTGCTQFQD